MGVTLVSTCWGSYADELPFWLAAVADLDPPADAVIVAGTIDPGPHATWVRWDEDPTHPADALNSAIAAAGTEWVCCVDVDDRPTRSLLAVDAGDDADVVAVGVRYADSGRVWIPGGVTAGRVLESGENLVTAGSLFRRSMWERVGGYQASDGWVYDWGLWRRMAAADARFRCSGTVGYTHRPHAGSWSQSRQAWPDVERVRSIR